MTTRQIIHGLIDFSLHFNTVQTKGIKGKTTTTTTTIVIIMMIVRLK